MHFYELIAPYYDQLMGKFDYNAWADRFEACPRTPRTVLELGCGTGQLTAILAARGYDIVATDSSGEMLAVAANRDWSANAAPPLFLCQTMEELDLYGTCQAAVCCLDGFNHLSDAEALQATFSRIHLFLEPDGLLFFDVLTPAHFAAIDGQTYTSQDKNAFACWTSECENNRCDHNLTLFTRASQGLWQRATAQNTECIFPLEEVSALLKEAGFSRVTVQDEGSRAYFTALV